MRGKSAFVRRRISMAAGDSVVQVVMRLKSMYVVFGCRQRMV